MVVRWTIHDIGFSTYIHFSTWMSIKKCFVFFNFLLHSGLPKQRDRERTAWSGECCRLSVLLTKDPTHKVLINLCPVQFHKRALAFQGQRISMHGSDQNFTTLRRSSDGPLEAFRLETQSNGKSMTKPACCYALRKCLLCVFSPIVGLSCRFTTPLTRTKKFVPMWVCSSIHDNDITSMSNFSKQQDAMLPSILFCRFTKTLICTKIWATSVAT